MRFRRAKNDELQLEQVRRLARELAERRDSAYAEVQAEVESLKTELRERAAAIAERERELTTNGAAAGDLAKAEELMRRAEAELKLAEAERSRLEEREQRVRAVEKELAALRVELTQKQPPQPHPPPRETTFAGTRFAPPPAPSFAEGLAALARSRNR